MNQDFLRNPPVMHLRTKLLIAMMSLAVLLTLPVMVVIEHRERKVIEGQVRKRGMAIARTLAALSTNALVTYNYVTLEQHVEHLASEDDVVYAIMVDREGHVAAYSGRGDLQRQQLRDPMARQAVEAVEPLIQVAADPRDLQRLEQIWEVVMPVFPPGVPDKWGTARVGISLREMQWEIQQARLTIAIVGGTAALLGCLAALVLAHRLTVPPEHLGSR